MMFCQTRLNGEDIAAEAILYKRFTPFLLNDNFRFHAFGEFHGTSAKNAATSRHAHAVRLDAHMSKCRIVGFSGENH